MKRGYKKLSIEDCKEAAKSRGGECLSEEYNIHRKIKWRCCNGHIWESRFASIRGSKNTKGTWCPVCADKRLTIVDAHKCASVKNGKCLSTIYINSSTKIKWECKEGHRWKADYNHVSHGTWCPECCGQRISIKDCVKSAKEKNGECLSVKYIGIFNKIKWKCKLGHIWESAYNNIRNKERWCPKCAGNLKLDIKQCILGAIKKDGKCLSKNYVNARTNLKWQCNEGHIWEAVADKVLNRGDWCPRCSKWKSQNILANIIKELIPGSNIFQNYREFDWLKYKNKMEIDIWLPNIKLAVEYDGQQHFFPVQFGGITKEAAEKLFKSTKKRDRIKNHLIGKHTDDINYFIRFSYKEKIDKEHVVKKFKKHGIL